MCRTMTGHISFDWQVARHDVVENLEPTFDVGIKNFRRLTLARVNLSVEEIAHKHDPLLWNVDCQVAGAMAAPFGCDLKGQAAKIERRRPVDGDIWLPQLFAFVGGVARIVGVLALFETFALLHL